MTEAYAFRPVIAIRKGRNAIHLSQQSGTWLGAALFTSTLCGREITTAAGWVEVQESATCARCERECANIDSERAYVIETDHAAAIAEDAERFPVASAEFRIGERVGIVRGLQSVNGPQVYMYGTVVRHFTSWNDSTEYVVLGEDGEELVYGAYLLRHVPERIAPSVWQSAAQENASAQNRRAAETAAVHAADTASDDLADLCLSAMYEGLEASQCPQDAPEDEARQDSTEGIPSDDSEAYAHSCPVCGAPAHFPCEDPSCSYAVPMHPERALADAYDSVTFGTIDDTPATREFTEQEFDTVSEEILAAVRGIAKAHGLAASVLDMARASDDAANALSRYGITR
jgi:hypothetical protein